MKFVNEFRDAQIAQGLAKKITSIVSRPWAIMEICGGQTHTIVKYGIDQLLPPNITLIHGPGCPVCVTPVEIIDRAIAIATQANVIFCSFGDMLRVPGSKIDLLALKATGADIRIVYTPLDCLKIAQQNPHKEIVFLAIGFETTVPATAMTIYQAKQLDLPNFSVLVSHVLVPPAMESILSAKDCCIQGFLAAGHVCTVTGLQEYIPIAKKYHIPIVVTGFEPLDILQGIYLCLQQLEAGQAEVQNQYSRSVRPEGNSPAIELITQIFQVLPQRWRGIGEIPRSGLGLKSAYSQFDAQKRFSVKLTETVENNNCISGLILQGIKKPHQCPAFGNSCTPERPLGAPMVSAEGACAAYYRYRHYQPKTDLIG